ncbi:carbohydrate ABC transporter permease [Facklamia sp. DSM 111018]|uniref:Carbohydrate ABC transporter permease n=1 Tax=Facklamia lactis TaxID=2749967 RepID=A0ABS0LSL5_9LACT|nr:carbohydrate ABC transporter permease [Facklamia lactis]MBG9981255.1 carbohydrate ABC transporter permease [Facklamia lactis]MBG9987057.1 carbohydrate ABC transporter permease [Facklamia lactis]
MKFSIIEKVIYGLAILLFCLFCLGPILWAFNISITPENEIIKGDSQIFSLFANIDNYLTLFDSTTEAHQTIMPAIYNSIKMATFSILIGLPIAVITAYAFYRYQFVGKKFVFLFIIITMVIPVFTTIIPIYAVFARNGLLDSLFWIAIIYVSAFLPMTTWIIYNYFKTLPYEVIEAAMLDGANEVEIFTGIVLPMSRPIIITATLVIFLMSWSQFQIPMLLTTTQANKVITLVIQDFQGRYSIEYGLVAASGILTIIPPMIVAIIFRKYLVSGLTNGATKG